MNKMHDFKNLVLAFSILLLTLAIFFTLPYGFYTLLRFVVCGFSLYVAYRIYKVYNNEYKTYLIYVFWAILFNPFIPVHFDKATWRIIDIVTIPVLCIPFLFKSFRNNEMQS
jgi:uncharacterized membrane protein